MNQDTLGDALPREMARVRDKLLPVYDAIPGGQIAAAMMRADLDEAAKPSPLEWKQMNVPDGCYINSGKDGWQFLIYVENEHFGVVFDTPKKRTVYNAEQFTAAEALGYVHELARVEVKGA